MSIKTQVSRHKKFFFNSKFETSMKHVIFIFLFFGLSAVSAQTNVEFAYDAAGNRIRRITIVLERIMPLDTVKIDTYSPESINEPVLASQDEVPIQSATNEEIQLYPNPTSGTLHLVLPRTDKFTEYRLFDQNGRLLMQSPCTSPELDIDLSAQPAGNYFLTIISQHTQNEFKIIKL